MGWKEALAALAETMEDHTGGVKAVVSPFWSNEDLGAVASLVDALGGGEVVYRSPRGGEEVAPAGYEGLARRKDLAPNVRGAELFGFKRVGDDSGQGGLDEVAGHTGVILVLGDALEDAPEGFGAQAKTVVYMGAYASQPLASAGFALPTTTFAEQEGTFTNHDGRVQGFWKALDAPGAARPAWLVLGALVGALEDHEGPRNAGQAFALLGKHVPAYEGITYEDVNHAGAVIDETVPMAGD